MTERVTSEIPMCRSYRARWDMYSRVHSFYEAHAGNKNYVQLAARSDARNFRLRNVHASPCPTRTPKDLLASDRGDFKP